MVINNLVDENSLLIRTIYNRASSMSDVIDFSLGDPDMPTPAAIKAAGCAAIMNNHTHYSANAGILELRKELCKYFKERDGVSLSPEEIIITVGGMGALSILFKALFNNSSEVILNAPYWGNYKAMIQINGGHPVIVNTLNEQNFTIDIDSIEKSISQKTKAIIINSPNNPTGNIVSYEIMSKLVNIARKYNLYLIADEVYRDIVFENSNFVSFLHFKSQYDKIVVINSFSKTFNMTGWRVGYAIATSDLIKLMTSIQENMVACAPVPSQYAALAALNCSPSVITNNRLKYAQRRQILKKYIENIRKITYAEAMGTFYSFIDISRTNLSSKDFSFQLLEQERVAVVPGIAFGAAGEGYIRLSCTIDEQKIIEGLKRIKRFTEGDKR